MKLVIRIFVLSIAVAGGVAAAMTPATRIAFSNHQTATASMPAPCCGGHWQCTTGQ